MLELKKAICSNNTKGVLITLKDGRCALVDLETKCVNIALLIDTFYKWIGDTKNTTIEEEKIVKDILKKPSKIIEYKEEKEYITNPKIKAQYDKLKKELGYDY